ncbi:MAG: S9 family peptidase [Deltaproteobacteria bacterium]|nr:S9 family peptidase [Deltaproteobacteria bacterium]
MKISHLSFIILLGVVACRAPVQCPTITPWQRGTDIAMKSVTLDPDIARIFNNRSTRKPPSVIRWSRDGNTIALLETSMESNDTQRLWLVDVARRRKRPLFLGDGVKPLDFTWMDATTLVVQSEQKIIKATIEGKISDIMPNEATISHIRPSPDGQWLAYTKKNNLFVFSLAQKQSTQLTHVGDDDAVCAGCVSWLYKEEFRTHHGFQWSADSRRIWFRRVNQQLVAKTAVALSDAGKTEWIPYSHAGSNNPHVTIDVVTLGPDTPTTVTLPIVGNDDVYLPEAMWRPGKPTIMVTRMDRLQTGFELLECTTSEEPQCETVFTQSDPRWVNYPGLPIFTPEGNHYVMRLELDNFAHIHLFDGTSHQHRALTKGAFPVETIRSVGNDSVVFTALKTDPLNTGVYRVSLADGIIMPVVESPGTHAPNYAPPKSTHASLFVNTFSRADLSPAVYLCDAQGTPLMRIDDEGTGDYHAPDDIVNEFAVIENDSDGVFYIQITRPNVTGDGKYPALVYVYGGPGFQAVSNRYNTTFTAWRNLMARRGFVIFTIDNRGSSGRGREFETAIHRNLTEVPLADQLMGVQWLKKQSYVDEKRLGIMGWSFGGTLTLSALLHTENLFRLGIAIAPVTDWRRYDTVYTERYMQRPLDNPENYNATDLTRQTAQLTERLLLVHGTGDRNVLWENSAAFINESVANGRSVQLQVYPGSGHSIDSNMERAHLFSEITRFIQKYL